MQMCQELLVLEPKLQELRLKTSVNELKHDKKY